MTNITEAGYWVASNRTFPQRPLGISRRWCPIEWLIIGYPYHQIPLGVYGE